MAALLGVENPASYSRYEAGRVPDLEILSDWANRIGISLDYFAGREEGTYMREEPDGVYRVARARLIPVISWAHAGEAEEYEEIPRDWQREIATTCRDVRAFGLELRGDSMLPHYNEGDVAVVMPSERPHGECLVVAKLKDNGVCFKVFSMPQKGLFRLTSYNPVYTAMDRTEDDFHWIYPVFEVVKNVWR